MMKCVAIISRADSSLFGDGVTMRRGITMMWLKMIIKSQ